MTSFKSFDLRVPQERSRRLTSLLQTKITIEFGTVGDITNPRNFKTEDIWRRNKEFYEDRRLAQLLRVTPEGQSSLYVRAKIISLDEDEEETTLEVSPQIPLITDFVDNSYREIQMEEHYYMKLSYGPIVSVGIYNMKRILDRVSYSVELTHSILLKQTGGKQITILRDPPTSVRLVENNDEVTTTGEKEIIWLV